MNDLSSASLTRDPRITGRRVIETRVLCLSNAIRDFHSSTRPGRLNASFGTDRDHELRGGVHGPASHWVHCLRPLKL